MPRVIAVAADGQEQQLDAAPDWTILDLARTADLPLEGTCGGQMACATCHVVVDPAWAKRLPRPSPEEADMIALAVRPRARSRLGCQVRLSENLDGLRFEMVGE